VVCCITLPVVIFFDACPNLPTFLLDFFSVADVGFFSFLELTAGVTGLD